jgi:hypothetical protein
MPPRKDSSRHELTLAVLARKELLWGQGDRKYSPQRSAQNIISGVPRGNPPSKDLLRWAAYEASDTELYVMAASRNPEYGFLYYK